MILLKILVCVLAFIAGLTLLAGFVALADGEIGASVTCFIVCTISALSAVFIVVPLLKDDGTVAVVNNFLHILT